MSRSPLSVRRESSQAPILCQRVVRQAAGPNRIQARQGQRRRAEQTVEHGLDEEIDLAHHEILVHPKNVVGSPGQAMALARLRFRGLDTANEHGPLLEPRLSPVPQNAAPAPATIEMTAGEIDIPHVGSIPRPEQRPVLKLKPATPSRKTEIAGNPSRAGRRLAAVASPSGAIDSLHTCPDIRRGVTDREHLALRAQRLTVKHTHTEGIIGCLDPARALRHFLTMIDDPQNAVADETE